MINSILWRGLAISLAIAATGADGFNTLSQAVASGMTPDMIATVAVAIAAMSLALPLSVWSYRNQNRVYGLAFGAVFLITWAVSYGFSLNRMGHNRMNEVHTIEKANLAGVIASEKVTQARASLKAAQADLSRESVTGKGPRWKEAFARANYARADLRAAEDELRKAGPSKTSRTIEQTAYLVYLLPLTAQLISIFGFLIGFGSIKTDARPNVQPREKSRRVIEQLKEPVTLHQAKSAIDDAVYNVLKRKAKKGEWSSTYREIAENADVGLGSVGPALSSLENKGRIGVDTKSKGRGTRGRIIA